MTSEHELFIELRDARQEARKAADAEAQAKAAWQARRAALRKARAVVEEILEEIETGRSRRPLMDAMNGSDRPGAPPESVTDGVERAARSGLDLVTSHPGSIAGTNGDTAGTPPSKRRRKKTTP